tara:strand:+ start:82 stop:342 length:261 start_codon:yes stop_codon:yes gene_type:complete
MATILLPAIEVSSRLDSIISMLWDYLEMKYPYQNILHSTTDDKIFINHGHQMKVIEWLVHQKILFQILDYDTIETEFFDIAPVKGI